MNNCPICLSVLRENESKIVPYPAEGDKKLKNKPKSIIFCEKCGIGIAVPVWTIGELEKFYAGGNYWANRKIEMLLPKKYPIPYALAVSRWKFMEPLLEGMQKPVSILDIGAGHGFLGMAAARSKHVRFEKYTYVEKDKMLVESFRKTWSIHFSGYPLEIEDNIDNINGNYDITVLSQVLEHQNNPKKLLETVLAKLTTGGFVFVDVPNQDYLFKKDVFPHFLFFNKLSLGALLINCGLKVRRIDCYGTDMKRSKANYRNVSILDRAFMKIIFGLSLVMPEKFFLSFFSWYFGTNEQNDDGTWVRAIAQNC